MTYTVYMLRCNDCSYYTGYTGNMERRLGEHRSGKGGKYTRSRLPVRLVYTEEHPHRRQALRREKEIKRFNRKEKTKLIKSQNYVKLHSLITM